MMRGKSVMTKGRMMKQEVRDKIFAKTQVEELLQNKGFIDIIMPRYMRESIHDLMYREGSSNGVTRGIDARKDLNDFLFNIIEEGKLAEER